MGFLMRLQIPPAEKISVLQKLLADDVLEVRSMSCFFLCVCVCFFLFSSVLISHFRSASVRLACWLL